MQNPIYGKRREREKDNMFRRPGTTSSQRPLKDQLESLSRIDSESIHLG
jgi:hypothetical protein